VATGISLTKTSLCPRFVRLLYTRSKLSRQSTPFHPLDIVQSPTIFRSLQETLFQAKELINTTERKQAVAQDLVRERSKDLDTKKTAYTAYHADNTSQPISWFENSFGTYHEAKLAYEASVKSHYEAFNAYRDAIKRRAWAEDGMKLVQDRIKRHKWTERQEFTTVVK